MAQFSYTILNKAGKETKGKIDADSREDAISLLKSEGNTVVSVNEVSALNKDINIQIGGKITSRQIGMFCRQFRSIIGAGVSIVSALEMLAEQTENKMLKNAIFNVHNQVETGMTLSEAMNAQKVFPSILVHMVAAGEASGSLETSFERMATHFEKDAKLKGMVKKAMIYPLVLLCVAITVMIVMLVVVIPSYSEMFAEMDAELPGITKAMMAGSDFIISKWYMILLVIAAIILVFRLYKSTPGGSRVIARIVLKIPVFGTLVVKSSCSRFSRTLSTLIAAGMNLVDSLNITAKAVGNVLYQDEIESFAVSVQQGIPLSQLLKRSELFPPMITHMTGIGEETGDIEEMLTNAANYYDEEVETTTAQAMALIEPLIIIVMALMVVLLIGSIYTPMMSLYDNIQ